jgi:hypothetical protein
MFCILPIYVIIYCNNVPCLTYFRGRLLPGVEQTGLARGAPQPVRGVGGVERVALGRVRVEQTTAGVAQHAGA